MLDRKRAARLSISSGRSQKLLWPLPRSTMNNAPPGGACCPAPVAQWKVQGAGHALVVPVVLVVSSVPIRHARTMQATQADHAS